MHARTGKISKIEKEEEREGSIGINQYNAVDRSPGVQRKTSDRCLMKWGGGFRWLSGGGKY